VPELPEVETVRRGLAPAMEGQKILRADVNRPDLRWPFPENMAARLTGATITALRRRSKYVLADLDTYETLIIHLGMSGRMTVSGDPLGQFHHDHPAAQKHDHVVFHMANGARVTFNDARRFGAMDLAQTAQLEEHWLIKPIGPEPLGNMFDEPYLIAKLAGKNTPIKTALLDQRILAGLGNIYVCEVLFRAGIKRVGRLCATIDKPTGNLDIFSMDSPPTTAKATAAKPKVARERSGASCSRADPRSIAPNAKDSLPVPPTLVTLSVQQTDGSLPNGLRNNHRRHC